MITNDLLTNEAAYYVKAAKCGGRITNLINKYRVRSVMRGLLDAFMENDFCPEYSWIVVGKTCDLIGEAHDLWQPLETDTKENLANDTKCQKKITELIERYGFRAFAKGLWIGWIEADVSADNEDLTLDELCAVMEETEEVIRNIYHLWEPIETATIFD